MHSVDSAGQLFLLFPCSHEGTTHHTNYLIQFNSQMAVCTHIFTHNAEYPYQVLDSQPYNFINVPYYNRFVTVVVLHTLVMNLYSLSLENSHIPLFLFYKHIIHTKLYVFIILLHYSVYTQVLLATYISACKPSSSSTVINLYYFTRIVLHFLHFFCCTVSHFRITLFGLCVNNCLSSTEVHEFEVTNNRTVYRACEYIRTNIILEGTERPRT